MTTTTTTATAATGSGSGSSKLEKRSLATLPMPPGPEPIPLLGAVPRLISFARDPIGNAGRLFDAYGPVAAIVRGEARMMSPGGRHVLLVNGPSLNREVLTEHERFHMRALPGVFFPSDEDIKNAGAGSRLRGKPSGERLRPIQRTLTGLFHVNDNDHRRHRRLLQPAFNKTRIDAYRQDMVNIVSRTIDEWSTSVGEVRDVHTDLTELTLRIATKTLFGEDAGAKGVELARMMQGWLVTMFSPAMLLRLDLPRTAYGRWLDLTTKIDRATVELLRQKQRTVAAAKDGAVAPDMLSMLVAARDEDGSALEDDELIGHTGVIFAAGHETSTNALAWTLFLLSQHPRVAADLVDELHGALRGAAPSVEQLSAATLPLLDAVVRESMRVLPPVPLHPRITSCDTELGGYFLPKSTELFLSIFHMHHDSSIFENPDRFLPERWMNPKFKPTVYEYNPFSAGPRMCIGAAFAMMEIKIALAMLLQRYRVELPPKSVVDRRVAITMAPKHGLKMRIRRADNAWSSAPHGAAAVRGNIHEVIRLS